MRIHFVFLPFGLFITHTYISFLLLRTMKINAIVVLVCFLFLAGCKHDPLTPPNGNPNPGAPVVNSQGCSPDTVYFENDILPLLISNCAMSGCHDAQSRADGINLTTYAGVISGGEVRPGNPNSSDLYEKLVEDDLDKRMPPPPYPALAADKIALVRRWIEQGAKNNACRDTSACDTLNMRFSSYIQPLLQANCVGCHGNTNPSAGINLSTLSAVQAMANTGRLVGAISKSAGYVPMPPAGNGLSNCEINRVKAWINQGMQP